METKFSKFLTGFKKKQRTTKNDRKLKSTVK